MIQNDEMRSECPEPRMPTERCLNELSFHKYIDLFTFYFIDIDLHFNFSSLHCGLIAKIGQNSFVTLTLNKQIWTDCRMQLRYYASNYKDKLNTINNL